MKTESLGFFLPMVNQELLITEPVEALAVVKALVV